MQGPKSIPKGVVVIGNPFMDLIVERTVVASVFRKFPREQHGMEQGSVENALLIFRSAIYLDSGKVFLPYIPCILYHFVKIPVRYLLGQVFPSLFQTYKGSRNFY